MVVTTDVEVVVGKVLHDIDEQMEVLLPAYLSDGKEEGSSGSKRGFGLRLLVDSLHGIVDDLQGCGTEIEVLLYLLAYKLGDAGEGIGLAYHPFYLPAVLETTRPPFLSQPVEVVDGANEPGVAFEPLHSLILID